MKKIIGLVLITLSFLSTLAVADVMRYGENFCSDPRFTCITVKSGQTWAKLWPDAYQRELVKRLNRMNINLYAGMVIAVPNNLGKLSLKDIAPFAATIPAPGHKLIVVEPSALAWGAYNAEGKLQYWGPISAGRIYCPDVGRACRTSIGDFNFYRKDDADCTSKIFPVDKAGGAPMPFCMFFHGGYAMHGSPEVPGYHASHGCVRMYPEDAKWLNENFIDLPLDENGKGTEVIINPYTTDS